MKKAVKIALHVFSLALLALLVLTGSFFNKLSKESGDAAKGKKNSDGNIFSAFTPDQAFADASDSGSGVPYDPCACGECGSDGI